MKLLRVGDKGKEQPAILDKEGTIRSLKSVVADIAGASLSAPSLAELSRVDPSQLPVVDTNSRIGPCVGDVRKIICIGLNYSDHVAESGMQMPAEPVVFMKATSAISGPFDPVEIPRGSTKTDWEVELGVVIGNSAKYVSEDSIMEHVAGYCIINDYSEREFQLERSGQWVKGKSHDTFAPIGPWLVTKDEIPDPHALSLWLEVDGKRFQDSSTSNMIFRIPKLVSYLSQFMSLHPGDIISTGTPPGVGLGLKPPTFLRSGQSICCGIEGLGEQKQCSIHP